MRKVEGVVLPRSRVLPLGPDRGASAAEYSLLAALIATGLVTVVMTLGTTLPHGFSAVSDGIAGHAEGEPAGQVGVGRGANGGNANGHGSGSGGDGGNSGKGGGSDNGRNP